MTKPNIDTITNTMRSAADVPADRVKDMKPFLVYLSVGEMIAEIRLLALDADHARQSVQEKVLNHFFIMQPERMSILDVQRSL